MQTLCRTVSQPPDAQKTKNYMRDQAKLKHPCGTETMNSTENYEAELIECQASPPSPNGERPLLAESLVNTLSV